MYCQNKQPLASVTARETLVNSFPSPEKFLLCTDKIESFGWQNPAPRQRIDDCSVIHLPRRGLVISCYHVTKLFCAMRCFTNASSAGSSCNFGSQAYFAISVFWEVSKDTVVPWFWYHFRRTFRIWVLRNVRGHMHLCFLKIVCELLQPFTKISQTFVRISIVIPLFILVFGYWVCLAPVTWCRFVTSLCGGTNPVLSMLEK